MPGLLIAGADYKKFNCYTKCIVAIKPVINEFYEWLGTLNAMGNLKKAEDYALNQKLSLMRVLDDGCLLLSNNHCEQQIKTLVIGRKNHFSQVKAVVMLTLELIRL